MAYTKQIWGSKVYYTGLSRESKPENGVVGAELIELDTGQKFFWDETAGGWSESDIDPLLGESRRIREAVETSAILLDGISTDGTIVNLEKISPDVQLNVLGRSTDWRQRAVLAGYGGHVTIGAQSTPITGGGAGTTIDPEQPEGVISVARGYTLVPLRITVQCHVPLLASDNDTSGILIAADRIAAWPGTGTNTSETVYNMLTNSANANGPVGVTAASAFTADTSTPTLDLELDKTVITGDVQGTPASALWTPLALIYEPLTPPMIVGPAAIYIYWYGTVATTGYAQAQFLCVPNTVLPTLL